MSPHFLFQTLNLGLQIRKIPDTEKAIRDIQNEMVQFFYSTRGGGRGGGETPHMKGVGMLVVSLRGINLRFLSHLGCSGQNANRFSREGLV